MGVKNWFISPSTQALIAEARKTPGYSFFDFVHGYIYGRWTYLYIGIGKGDHPISKRLAPIFGWVNKRIARKKRDQLPQANVGFADTYHGKTVPLETARRLVSVDEEIRIPDLEQVIPYRRARSLIMKNPDHIVALDCPCRMAKPNPCLPLDVCLIVGEPFASFVREHHPGHSRRITHARGGRHPPGRGRARTRPSRLLQGRHARPLLRHLQLLRVLLRRHAGPAQRHPHAGLLRLHRAAWTRTCAWAAATASDYCQFHALEVLDGTSQRASTRSCMGCGVCVSKCDHGALSLLREEGKGTPLEICSLMQEAVSAG